MSPGHDEARAVAERYAQRAPTDRYDPLRPEIMLARHERERAFASLLARHAQRPLAQLDVLEVGCGSGDNLLDLIRLGADPARLSGVELLADRFAAARRRLPAATVLHEGDALALARGDSSADIVVQSTVFTSLLDDNFQQRLAQRMWDWVRPGGGVLWYDFVVDNPANTHVRGVPVRRMRALFPHGRFDLRRVTLAPPVGRRVVRVHPALWRWLDALPWLRTHVLAWIGKPVA